MSVNIEAIGLEVGRAASSRFEREQWQMWIDDALFQIERRAVDSGKTLAILNQRAVDYVVRVSVAKHIKQPDNSTNVTNTVSVDDGSETNSKTYQTSRGRVDIDQSLWEMLGLTGESGKAFMVQTIPTGLNCHSPYCALMWNANYCSCGSDINRLEGPIFEVPDAW